MEAGMVPGGVGATAVALFVDIQTNLSDDLPRT
jgi:hypothetical protein